MYLCGCFIDLRRIGCESRMDKITYPEITIKKGMQFIMKSNYLKYEKRDEVISPNISE